MRLPRSRFLGAFQTRSDNITQLIGETEYTWNIKPISQYAFFYRRNFCEGAEARLWAGFTGDKDGLFGGDLRIPLVKASRWRTASTTSFQEKDEVTTAPAKNPGAWS